jgi:hypothetical protein
MLPDIGDPPRLKKINHKNTIIISLKNSDLKAKGTMLGRLRPNPSEQVSTAKQKLWDKQSEWAGKPSLGILNMYFMTAA